jgi:hypothetical protein
LVAVAASQALVTLPKSVRVVIALTRPFLAALRATPSLRYGEIFKIRVTMVTFTAWRSHVQEDSLRVGVLGSPIGRRFVARRQQRRHLSLRFGLWWQREVQERQVLDGGRKFMQLRLGLWRRGREVQQRQVFKRPGRNLPLRFRMCRYRQVRRGQQVQKVAAC